MNFIDSPMNNLNVITSNQGPGSIFVPFVKKNSVSDNANFKIRPDFYEDHARCINWP